MSNFSRRKAIAIGTAGVAGIAATVANKTPVKAQTKPLSQPKINPNGRFADRVVLITGATSGIGEATARAFAAEGATVHFCGRPHRRFSKSNFNPDELCNVARNLLYTKEIKRIMAEQLTEPSADFVKFFASQVYSGKMVTSVVEKFTEITKRSLIEFINERITDRLKSAIALPQNTTELAILDSPKSTESELDTTLEDEKIITTEEELEGFYIIKAIMREGIDVKRIQYKDTKIYFGINLDGKVTKTICRLYFNSTKKYVGLLDATGKEVRKAISNLDEIYGIAGILKDRVNYLTKGKYIGESASAETI